MYDTNELLERADEFLEVSPEFVERQRGVVARQREIIKKGMEKLRAKQSEVLARMRVSNRQAAGRSVASLRASIKRGPRMTKGRAAAGLAVLAAPGAAYGYYQSRKARKARGKR